MKLNDVLKSKSYITLSEARATDIGAGVRPVGNKFGLFFPNLKDPYYVFDTSDEAVKAQKEANNIKTSQGKLDFANKYSNNRRLIDANAAQKYLNIKPATLEELERREENSKSSARQLARSQRNLKRENFIAKMKSGSRASLFKGLSLVGLGATPFYGVILAIQDVIDDDSLSVEQKEQLTDILKGQLLIQLIFVLTRVFGARAMIVKAWPVWAVVIGGLAAYGAVRESTQVDDSKQRLDEAVPLVAAAAWQGLRMAGQWLARGAITRAAAARTATSAAARKTATSAATAVTSRATIGNLAKMAPDAAAAILMSSPAAQRWLAEALAGYWLTDLAIGNLGNGVEGLVDAVAEIFPNSVTNFLQDNLNKPSSGYDETTTGGGGEYFGNTEWAKNVFGSMLFPPEQKSKLVPYIGPGRREDLLNGAMNLNPIDANQPQPEEPSVNSGAPGFRPGQ